MKTVTAVLLGAGGRGYTYGRYALDYLMKSNLLLWRNPTRDRRENS